MVLNIHFKKYIFRWIVPLTSSSGLKTNAQNKTGVDGTTLTLPRKANELAKLT